MFKEPTNPFEKGDSVYHAVLGNCLVKEAHPGVMVTVQAGCLTEHVHFLSLSFEPWPKPCHERVIEDGVYVVTYQDIPFPLVRAKVKGKWFVVNKSYEAIGDPIVDTSKMETIKKLVT